LLESGTGSAVQQLSKITVGIIFLYTLPVVLKRNLRIFIFTYLVAIFIFLVNYMVFTENQVFITGLIFPFFFMCLPAFIYTMSLENINGLKVIMKKGSLIIFLFGAIIGILIFTGSASVGIYSQSLSYYMLVPTIIFLDRLFRGFSLPALFIVVFSIIVIIAFGSRGALLCILIYVLLKSIRPSSKLTRKTVLINMLFSGLIIIIYLNINQILTIIYYNLLEFGINSRSLQLFFREDVYLSGRESIYQSVLEAIKDNPIKGIGIGGDRLVSGEGYAHNIFLEIIANFGIVIGGMLSVLIIIIILKSLITKDKENYSLITIWMSLGFIHLLVSSSYITDINFWIFMGLLTKQMRLKFK
jgi:O-antigen ligase